MFAQLKVKKEKVHEEAKKLIAEWKPSMSRMLETCITFEPSFCESQDYALFDSNLPVYILGEKYVSKNGGTGPTTDQGWGCMLRCGQMLLARALIVRHLGHSWRWNREVKPMEYKRILRMFQDKKSSLFSIHQIANMGVSEGKEIGEWFGPNTAAQVLKKLVIYDNWSRLAVHVALDNVLITSDVRTMAFTKPPYRKSRSRSATRADCCDFTIVDPAEAGIYMDPPISPSRSDNSSLSSFNGTCEDWRPLLIIIPLRLGLSTMNHCYFPAIQAFFQLPQCVGIIGGRPNHALYFVGIVDNDLLYLDPHFCQDFLDLDEITTVKDKSGDGYVEVKNGDDVFDDSTYHCPFILRTKFDKVDPSLALALLCRTEEEYGQLVQQLQTHLLLASTPPLFELLETRPKTFPPFVPYVGENAKLQDYTDLGEVNDSYDEFELLE